MADVRATVNISDDFNDETHDLNHFDSVRVEQDEHVNGWCCQNCGIGLTAYLGENGETLYQAKDGTETCTDDDGEEKNHIPDRVVLSWWNGSRIYMNEEHDEVGVTISADDPRGAFHMTIRRVPDDSGSDYAGRLLLSLPYENMGWSHMYMTQINDGTYLLSNGPSEEDAGHRRTDITKLMESANDDERETIRRLADLRGLKY